MCGSEALVRQTETEPGEIRRIYEECGGDLEKVAQRLGVPYQDFITNHGLTLAAPSTLTVRRRTPPETLGQRTRENGGPDPKLIISCKHVDSPTWPKDDMPRIEAARRHYELGTHEMCQGREGDWFILYSIPRVKRTGPRKFFQTVF